MTTKVTFQLPAEYAANASEGILLGEFNNWNPEQATQLQRSEDGSLVAEIALAAGKTYQYRYFLSDGRWVNDNSNTTWAELYGGYVENCVVEVPEDEKPIVENKIAAIKTTAPKKITNVKAKTVADDLSKIPGISKKTAALLKKQGVISFTGLSKYSVKNLKAILATAGEAYNKIDPTLWPKQAKLAAAGKWEELNTLPTASKSSK
jgi:predicted flap endonuclease-1-like 5' DNA nuclease